MKNKHTMTLGRLWELFWYQICIVPRLYTDLNLSETNKKEISSKHRSIYKKKTINIIRDAKRIDFFIEEYASDLKKIINQPRKKLLHESFIHYTVLQSYSRVACSLSEAPWFAPIVAGFFFFGAGTRLYVLIFWI